ncbi:MAG: hypothetical protein JNM99_21030 [Verrucomicrobiaceae bacterium]|nr:hypothetical protein [Verrucomicrobiaceae bacterium]
MFWLVFFLLVWIALSVVARRLRLSWILSVGGTLILALLVLMATVSLFSNTAAETTPSAVIPPAPAQPGPQPDAALVELWKSLPPPPEAVKGMSLAETEHLYRRLCVMDWNGDFYLGVRRWPGAYSELAEKWEMHVDVIAAAFDYVASDRVWRLSQAVGKHFKDDPHVRHASVQSTAWAGTYTLRANLEVEGSPKDPGLPQEAERVARDLVRRLPAWITGMKIGTVHYQWPKTGTSGNLTPAFLWRRNPEEFRVMTLFDERSDRVKSVEEKRWIQPSWNDGQRAEE